jgi:hypothetical protein
MVEFYSGLSHFPSINKKHEIPSRELICPQESYVTEFMTPAFVSLFYFDILAEAGRRCDLPVGVLAGRMEVLEFD